MGEVVVRGLVVDDPDDVGDVAAVLVGSWGSTLVVGRGAGARRMRAAPPSPPGRAGGGGGMGGWVGWGLGGGWLTIPMMWAMGRRFWGGPGGRPGGGGGGWCGTRACCRGSWRSGTGW